MKKRVLFYLAAVISAFSMQSCVTNYVAAAPSTYNKEYKTDAKLTASIDTKKLEENRKELISSFTSSNKAKVASLDNSLKNADIARAAKRSKTIDGILAEAETYIGTPYRFGGMTRNGIDCSAFVLSVFGSAAGMTLPRVAAAQSQEGERIEKSDLQKGDLIFFSHGSRISHVGIVYDVAADGAVRFIHAATSRGVMISNLTDSYWAPKYRFAKRIIGTGMEALAKLN